MIREATEREPSTQRSMTNRANDRGGERSEATSEKETNKFSDVE